MEKAPVANWRLTVEYNGRGYHGWQKQPDRPSIQVELESALATILREPVDLTGSGRTDAGVHALGQVANFATNSAIEPERLAWRVNAVLPDDISVNEIREVPDSFHARFSATKRTYGYYILNRPSRSPFWPEHAWWISKTLDIEAMREAAAYLLGIHDFKSFTVAQKGSTVRELTAVDIEPADSRFLTPVRDSRYYGLLRVRVAGNAFLHHMVRLMVGTLAEVATGKRPPGDIKKILEAQDVRLAGPRAPAKGLWLERVDYDGRGQ